MHDERVPESRTDMGIELHLLIRKPGIIAPGLAVELPIPAIFLVDDEIISMVLCRQEAHGAIPPDLPIFILAIRISIESEIKIEKVERPGSFAHVSLFRIDLLLLERPYVDLFSGSAASNPRDIIIPKVLAIVMDSQELFRGKSAQERFKRCEVDVVLP